ncbi:MAG: PqqD family peptide modification chaperone [Halobacteriota archaeon]
MEYKKNRTITSAETDDIIAPEINLTGMVVANATVSCRIEGEDGALLFNPDTDNTLLINPVGLSVWTFLAQPRTVDDIVSYLTTLFSDNPDHSVVKQDVETFIRELVPDFVSEVDADAAKLHSS